MIHDCGWVLETTALLWVWLSRSKIGEDSRGYTTPLSVPEPFQIPSHPFTMTTVMKTFYTYVDECEVRPRGAKVRPHRKIRPSSRNTPVFQYLLPDPLGKNCWRKQRFSISLQLRCLIVKVKNFAEKSSCWGTGIGASAARSALRSSARRYRGGNSGKPPCMISNAASCAPEYGSGGVGGDFALSGVLKVVYSRQRSDAKLALCLLPLSSDPTERARRLELPNIPRLKPRYGTKKENNRITVSWTRTLREAAKHH